MQKKLIALAIASLAAPAFAQSNVTISGSLDAMYTQYTNDGDAGAMLKSGNGHGDTTHKTNRLNFKGTEDLGNGMKAFFELEERFHIDNGATDTASRRFARSSWVGLQGGFGKVYLGRTPTAGDMVFGGGKMANDDTIADWGSRKGKMDDRQSNGVLYQAPKLGPVQINVHTSVKEVDVGETPYGVSVGADFKTFFVEGAYQKDGVNEGTGTAGNAYKSYFVNGGVRLSAVNLYAYAGQSKGYMYEDDTLGVDENTKETRYAIGADTKIGSSGILRVNLGQAVFKEDGEEDVKYNQLGVTYSHSLSKRTRLIAAATFEKSDAEPYQGEETRMGMQVGVRHAF